MYIDKKILTILLGIVVVAVVGGVYMKSTKVAEAPAITESTEIISSTPTPQAVEVGTPTTTATPAVVSNSLSSALKQLPAKTQTPVAKPVTKPTFTTVTYSGNDFLPRKVTIMINGTVRFYNNSDHDMWVASDIHPLHNGYPEKSSTDCAGSTFDECKAVPKGGYWDFVFHKDGTWKYHNHRVPIDDGEIEVRRPGDTPSIPGY
jgi:hypothetical protein